MGHYIRLAFLLITLFALAARSCRAPHSSGESLQIDLESAKLLRAIAEELQQVDDEESAIAAAAAIRPLVEKLERVPQDVRGPYPEIVSSDETARAVGAYLRLSAKLASEKKRVFEKVPGARAHLEPVLKEWGAPRS